MPWSATLVFFLLHTVRIADNQGRLELFTRRIENHENGIAREVVVLHVASRVARQRKPIVLAVEIARVTSDNHILLREFYVFVSLGKRFLLVEDDATRLDGHRVDRTVFVRLELEKFRAVGHGEDFLLGGVWSCVTTHIGA